MNCINIIRNNNNYNKLNGIYENENDLKNK
jgi:hypothetical protein